MWSATTGQTLWKYSPFFAKSYIFDVVWSPDGKRIAAAGSKSLVWLLDPTNGHLLATLNDQSGFVLGLAWSPDSKHIAIGDESGTVNIKDVTSGKTLFTYKGHSGPVARVAWAPDGTRIASASYDGTVQIWNATTGQRILTYSDAKAPVWSVAWSPDGKRIVSGTGSSAHEDPVTTNNSIKVWDATTGKTIITFVSASSSEAYAVAWSPDGTQVASGGDDVQVHIWNAATGQVVYQHQGQKDLIWKIAWSPDGTKIAAASQDFTVVVWSAKS
jgi:WD40 repeat protein